MDMKYIILLIFVGFCMDCERKFKQGNAENVIVDIESEFNSALALLEEKKYQEAKEKFLMLEKLSQELVGVKMNLSMIESHIGTEEESIRYAEEAFELSPNNIGIARYLLTLTEEEKYANIVYELENKILEVNSKTYFNNFVNRSPIVNSEYVFFELKIDGRVTYKDDGNQVLYLYGDGFTKDEGVQCINLPKDFFDVTEIGDTISFIGFSFGQGEDIAEPMVVYKRMK